MEIFSINGFRLFDSLRLLNLATILRHRKIAIFDKADYIKIEPAVLTLKYPITDKHSDLPPHHIGKSISKISKLQA